MQIGRFVVGLSPAFAFMAGVFIIVSCTSPSPDRRRSLITVSRNLSAVEYSYSNTTFRSPIVSFGAFGGCSQDYTGALVKCSKGNSSAKALPPSTARSILKPPPNSIVILTLVSVAFTLLFCVFWVIFLLCNVNIMGTHWLFSYGFEYIPFLALVLGLIPFLAMYALSFKICHDFNSYHEFQTKIGNFTGEANYVAKTGTGFLLVWIAYGFIFHTTTVFWVRKYTTLKAKEDSATGGPPPRDNRA